MWFTKYKRFVLVLAVVLSCSNVEKCIAISNTQFNASLRDYSAPEDINSTDVSTLQKDLQERYAQQAPVSNKIRFVKGIPDSVLSGSSHGRGLLHLNHHGYGIADYEESPHFSYGYEHHYPTDDHYGHFDDDHHVDHHHSDHHHPDHHHGHHLVHHDDHKHSYGHHYKHYDHALATKAVLWPIAGIALLGAAAALVTNPVLLQLGVVSGKRRRRDAEDNITNKLDSISKNDEIEDSLIVKHLKNFNKDADSITRNGKRNSKSISNVRRGVFLNKSINNNQRLLFGNINPTVKAAFQTVYANKLESIRDSEDKRFIPVPLKMRDSN